MAHYERDSMRSVFIVEHADEAQLLGMKCAESYDPEESQTTARVRTFEDSLPV